MEQLGSFYTREDRVGVKSEKILQNCRLLVEVQARDDALFLDAPRITEAYFQMALRALHAAIENKDHYFIEEYLNAARDR
jgi:hypothetical protein